MEPYLIDTNVAIGYLGGKMPLAALDFLDQIIDSTPNISIITKIELLGYNALPPESELLGKLIDASIIIELNRDVVDATILIRKQRKIKIPDAIIAASALELDFTLLTRNVEDFKGISGLKVVNPWLHFA
jgi:predicted nucleic acid-binding protein